MLVVGICGSAAASHRTRALIDLALEGARQAGADETEIVDLSNVTLQFADGRATEAYDEATLGVLALVHRADAYVIGSPMYRGSITGALKNLIDLIPREYLVGKAAALVATGASDHHYLGLELGLRAAMAFFQVHTVPGILYGSRFTLENGRVSDDKLANQARQIGTDVVLLARGVGGVAIGPSLY